MSKVLALAFAVALAPGFQSQPSAYAKGDIVRLATPAGSDPLPDTRVIAVAGDRIHADKSGITVNREPVRDVSSKLLEQIAETWDQVVPPGHYFVIAERQTDLSAVRYHGLIPAAKILRKVTK